MTSNIIFFFIVLTSIGKNICLPLYYVFSCTVLLYSLKQLGP